SEDAPVDPRERVGWRWDMRIDCRKASKAVDIPIRPLRHAYCLWSIVFGKAELWSGEAGLCVCLHVCGLSRDVSHCVSVCVCLLVCGVSHDGSDCVCVCLFP